MVKKYIPSKAKKGSTLTQDYSSSIIKKVFLPFKPSLKKNK